MRNGARKRVLIIQSQSKQYRVPFFDRLYAALGEDGIALRVAYSDPPPAERAKLDNCDLSPKYGVKVKSYWGLGYKVIWQPLFGEVAAADLVVVEHANKYVMNHLLLLCSSLGVKKMAYWGLGENRQADQVAISEWYRRKTLNRSDWWFAYTTGTAEYLARQGVSRQKITAVQNSVDTYGLQQLIATIPQETISEVKRGMGIPAGAHVGVFCGMLDPVKAVPFLIESAKLVKKEIPEFHLVIAGGGPDAPLAERAASSVGGWIHSVGPKFGIEKALTLKLADVFLLPGRVGLAILDAFAAGLPLVTTDIPIHGPEVEYLQEGVNGVKVQREEGAYSRAVIEVLANPRLLQTLKQGATRSAEQYSIEAMVRNFHDGISRCFGMQVG